MKAAEALITWDNEPEPRVCVSPLWAESVLSRQLEYSGGAAWQERRSLKGRQQIACVLADFVILTIHYGLPPALVHKAFLEIDEYREAIQLGLKVQYDAPFPLLK